MPKTNYVPVQGLASIGGEKPVGVQTRFKAATGPFLPRSVDPDGGVVTISTWRRGDVTLKHIDDLPVQREDLIAGEILEVAAGDLQAAYEILTRARGQRDRAISEASGYDGTTTGPNGETVHADADGTVLTSDEVAALQGRAAPPGFEEAQAWWEEQTYIDGAYEDVVPSTIAELVGRIPLNEIEYIATLEGADGYEASPQVLAAINKRMAAHADAVTAPGWSPLEAGLPIVEVRRRLGTISDARIVADLFESEKKGSGRKRVLQAVDARLEQLGGPPAAEGVPDLMANLEDSLASAKAAVPPLPGEDEPVAAVDEEPFG